MNHLTVGGQPGPPPGPPLQVKGLLDSNTSLFYFGMYLYKSLKNNTALLEAKGLLGQL